MIRCRAAITGNGIARRLSSNKIAVSMADLCVAVFVCLRYQNWNVR